MIKNYLKLLRSYQYIKNLFIFAPIFFAFKFKEFYLLLDTIYCFFIFCLIASSIYIINDILDIEEDKLHPEKRNRPLPKGLICKRNAFFLSISLTIISLLFSFFFLKKVFIIIIIYYILNLLYSIKLKNYSIVDVFIVAIGFVLRVFAGAFCINILPSNWIVVITFLLALFLAFAKRRNEIIINKSARKNLCKYNEEFLNAAIILSAGITIVSYILYTVSEEVILRLKTENLCFTSFFVIFGILRYMQIIFVEKKSGDPSKIVIKDNIIKAIFIGWILTFIMLVLF